jgi:hypothetical protein
VKNNANYACFMGLVTLAIPAGTWVASKNYAAGDCVRPVAAQPESTLYYECTTPGTSAATAPTWPTTPGVPYTDGSVEWACRDASGYLSFDNLAFRYSDPAKHNENIGVIEFVRLLRFIRLWKKLGWTIEQTDTAISSLYRADLAPVESGDLDTVAILDSGFLTLLSRLGIVTRAMKTLGLTLKRDFLALLACFSPIGTHDGVEWVVADDGSRSLRMIPSLYRQLFLNPVLLEQDKVFADSGYGTFLEYVDVPYEHPSATLEQQIVDAAPGRIGYNHSIKRLSYTGVLDAGTRDALKAVAGVSPAFKQAVDSLYHAQRLATHAEALRMAFNLTGAEYEQVIAALGFDADTPLTIQNISVIFRHGWLARKLKISVRELVLLTQLTGLDPFTAPDPTNPAILRLVELVQSMRDRSFKSAASLYLIWNQDLRGNSAPDSAQVAAFARTLRAALAAVETEFTVADDPSGAIAQDRMAMVYGADAAAFFFGLLNYTLIVEVEFSDTDGTLKAGAVLQAIENAAGKTEGGVPKIAYDDFRKRLSYSGVLTITTKDTIKSAAGGDAAKFKTAVDNLCSKNQTVINPFWDRYPELQSIYNTYVSDTTLSVTEKRTVLLKAILPELIQRRKRQQALQSVSAMVNTSLAFTQTFLDPPTAPFPLHAAGHNDQPALNDFIALEKRGFSVQFFASDTVTGNIITSPDIATRLDYAPLVDEVGNPLPANPTPGAAISGVWYGYLEVPENGFFNFYIETDTGATVTLLLDNKPVSLTSNGSLWNNTNPAELKAGALCLLKLTVEKVRNVVRMQWEWKPKGQGRAVIPERYLYPEATFGAFKEAYVRFLKAVSLATGLGLTDKELAYLATHSDYCINGDGWLNVLPVSGNHPDPNKLLKPFQALLDYSRVKADISPSDDTLLSVLKDPVTATKNAAALLFTITRWNQTSLNDVLAHFSSSISELGHFDLFRRVYDAFALIQMMGIAATPLIQATTNDPTSEAVRNLQAALRARYDAAAWRDVVRPINDELRSLQRDALVAEILHQMRSHSGSEHIDTADKLFEYFLMDVQMEPGMQTSRIRHALSSVQLFIERCLMNLESEVYASAINDKRWTWMKRYRVWEANRKVYCFPGNWADFALRDDKSPFFKELENELLQSDITEETAATAMLNYLTKLEEVAKLEPCGIYHIPADQAKSTGEINHVVARTVGATRKYYYRRYEYGAWTPWEQIKLDIEDNPVIPVVWNDRLFLFWLRILKQKPIDPSQQPTSNDSTSLSEVSMQTITQDMKDSAKDSLKVTVQAVLCWSEYYNGKWQSTKTSDINNPVTLDQFNPADPGAFHRSQLKLSAEVGSENTLWLAINDYPASFHLYNTHSLPVPNEPRELVLKVMKEWRVLDAFQSAQSPPNPLVNRYCFGDIAFVKGLDLLSMEPLDRTILNKTDRFKLVEPCHQLNEPFDAPFFFEDSRNVFLVTTEEEQVRIYDHPGYGVANNPVTRFDVSIPPLVFVPDPYRGPKPWGAGGPVRPDPGFIDPAPIQRFVTEDAYIKRGIGNPGSVMYGNKQIGPSGPIKVGKTGAQQ